MGDDIPNTGGSSRRALDRSVGRTLPQNFGNGETVDVKKLMPLLQRLERLEETMDDGDARRRVTEIRADLGQVMLDQFI